MKKLIAITHHIGTANNKLIHFNLRNGGRLLVDRHFTRRIKT